MLYFSSHKTFVSSLKTIYWAFAICPALCQESEIYKSLSKGGCVEDWQWKNSTESNTQRAWDARWETARFSFFENVVRLSGTRKDIFLLPILRASVVILQRWPPSVHALWYGLLPWLWAGLVTSFGWWDNSKRNLNRDLKCTSQNILGDDYSIVLQMRNGGFRYVNWFAPNFTIKKWWNVFGICVLLHTFLNILLHVKCVSEVLCYWEWGTEV